MPYQVDVQPSGHLFHINAEQTVLEAALAEGILLPHSCREGTCGSCKGRVLSGQIDHADSSLEVLTQEEREAGYALFCRAKTRSNLQLNVPEVTELKGITIQKIAGRVKELEQINDDVVIVRLLLPPTMPFTYFPGQYIEVILKDGSRRSYSMATLPSADNQLEWHIRNTGGVFSSYAYKGLKERALLRLEGPFGTFYLRDTNKPMVFVASGTGFAPIKSLLLQLESQNNTRPVCLYWGGRQLQDLYLHAWVIEFARKHTWLTYRPVLSELGESASWQGATGYVHHQVLADFVSLADYEVYACGNPLMVDGARADFVNKRALDEKNFFADAFV